MLRDESREVGSCDVTRMTALSIGHSGMMSERKAALRRRGRWLRRPSFSGERMMPANPDFRDPFSIFNEDKVEYLIAGAHAVIYLHGPIGKKAPTGGADPYHGEGCPHRRESRSRPPSGSLGPGEASRQQKKNWPSSTASVPPPPTGSPPPSTKPAPVTERIDPVKSS